MSCGLFLDCEYAFLGASPDGIVTSSDEDRSKRLVEVKCPYKYRHTTIAEACKCSSFYCDIDDNSNVKLKSNHRYYSQIQGQMGISGFKQCDFVIYTNNDLQIVPVTFNPQFWKEMKQKLRHFYISKLIPFLFKE